MTDNADNFDDAASRLCRAFKVGEEPGKETVNTVVAELERFVRNRYRSLREEDAHDVVYGALLSFFKAAKAGKVDCDRAAPYLMQITINEAIDYVTSNARYESDVPIDQVDAVALLSDQMLLEKISDEQDVWETLAEMQGDSHHTCVKVLGHWLDLCNLKGHAPSSREVAEIVGVSHTTVINCLNEMRNYLLKRKEAG